MTDDFLDRVYSARTPEETRALYDAWSASYEDELTKHGYATPRRCSEALAAHMDDLTRPVLDFGCGTGLSGQALQAAGFSLLDGVDLSADMLEGARGKNVYRSLRQIAPAEDPVVTPGDYTAITAIGVIGAGAAPVETFDLIMNALAPGGRMVLSYNDHALENPVYEARIDAWTERGAARLLFREHGDHIPGIGVKSTVYVLAKT